MNESTPEPDPATLSYLIDSDIIPKEFCCCISQEIMTDPVKTIDGFTYDRSSIERWFIEHCTSPLTNIPLASKELVPNDELREQIIAYTVEMMKKAKEEKEIKEAD